MALSAVDTVDRDHAPRWLAESSRRSWWKCECGAEGECWGRASTGWAHHVAEAVGHPSTFDRE